MDERNLDALPRAYRIGLRMRALGADDELIADCLDIDPDAVVTLLEIGQRKFERIARPVADNSQCTEPGAGAGTIR